MKNKINKKLEFKKGTIVELTSSNLFSIRGGQINMVTSLVDRPTHTLCDRVIEHLKGQDNIN